MSDFEKPRLRAALTTDLRLKAQLMARVQTVQLLRLGETQIAELIREIESDPFFQRLLRPGNRDWKIIRFQPHPRTRLSDSFYEPDERTTPAGAPSDLADLLNERREVLDLIRRVGREKFETHFLRAEEALSPEELAQTLGLAPPEVKRIQDFLLAFSVRAEFFDASGRTGTDPSLHRRVVRLARLGMDADGEARFDLLSPHLARGRYDIRYDRLQAVSDGSELTPEEKRHLKAFVRRLELVNWRQNTLFRIMDLLCHHQRGWLAVRDALKRAPMTQRQMARKLAVAPSTVNRAIQDRSLVLPWGEEILLEELFCSRKNLCVDALEHLEEGDPAFSRMADRELQEKLKSIVGVSVPRRTLNTYRRTAAARDESADHEGTPAAS
jgi:DNA-directed RNA polymerase specialized sigma54-like protein